MLYIWGGCFFSTVGRRLESIDLLAEVNGNSGWPFFCCCSLLLCCCSKSILLQVQIDWSIEFIANEFDFRFFRHITYPYGWSNPNTVSVSRNGEGKLKEEKKTTENRIHKIARKNSLHSPYSFMHFILKFYSISQFFSFCCCFCGFCHSSVDSKKSTFFLPLQQYAIYNVSEK